MIIVVRGEENEEEGGVFVLFCVFFRSFVYLFSVSWHRSCGFAPFPFPTRDVKSNER